MFQGASALTLDAKGRMSVPSRYRDALQGQAEGRVTITKHPDGCLLLFPRPEWEVFRTKIAALPMDAHWWRRIFLGNASDVDLDGAGRDENAGEVGARLPPVVYRPQFERP